MVRIFLGGLSTLPPGHQPTGIFKQEQSGPVWIGHEGFVGDTQADRRVHGGPEKALHQYPLAHYERLAAAFPAAAPLLVPGSIGENLSVTGWDEGNVRIGDRFRCGQALIQVSQPRSPCWKIDSRYKVEGMTRFIEEQGLTGWYFRVLEEGAVAPGDAFERVGSDSDPRAVTIERLLQIWKAHRPYPAELEALATTPGLSPNWVRKLIERAAWLKNP